MSATDSIFQGFKKEEEEKEDERKKEKERKVRQKTSQAKEEERRKLGGGWRIEGGKIGGKKEYLRCAAKLIVSARSWSAINVPMQLN